MWTYGPTAKVRSTGFKQVLTPQWQTCLLINRLSQQPNMSYECFIMLYNHSQLRHTKNTIFKSNSNTNIYVNKLVIYIVKQITDRSYSQQSFWLVIEGKPQVLLITLTMAPLYSAVPESYDSVTVSSTTPESWNWSSS